jgi:hypothetical protein
LPQPRSLLRGASSPPPWHRFESSGRATSACGPSSGWW